MQKKHFWTFTTLALILALSGYAAASKTGGDDMIDFTDVPAQSEQFIEWESTIELTPEQEAIKKQALEAIPAPCCSDNTAYTCCCPCNMSKTVWGLSNWLIAEKGASADEVRTKAQEWIAAINPDGFSGDVCYTGGCGRPMHQNGCGGMGGAVRP